MILALTLLTGLGCTGNGSPPGEQDDDLDDDGYSVALGDCDDTDPTVHPLADEYCDGIDNDCDHVVDEGGAVDAELFYSDSDGDGFGDELVTQTACAAPEGWVEDATDCDDDDAAIYPGAPEIACNNILESCDGQDGDRIVPDQYAQLQDAISAANPGETICVYEGTYDAVFIDRSLTIIGQQGAGRTEIDADSGPAVHVQNVDGVSLTGLSFTDGDALSGGGLLVEYSSNIVVDDCVFSENAAEQGGAIAVLNSDDVTVSNTAFTRNSASSGGAVSIWSSDSVDISGCIFESNSADSRGGALSVVNATAITVTDSFIQNGNADEGGGISALSSGLILADTDITGNRAEFGGGLYLEQAGLAASGGMVSGNEATGSSEAEAAGGGLYAFGGSVTLSGTVFEDNAPDDAHCEATSGC